MSPSPVTLHLQISQLFSDFDGLFISFRWLPMTTDQDLGFVHAVHVLAPTLQLQCCFIVDIGPVECPPGYQPD